MDKERFYKKGPINIFRVDKISDIKIEDIFLGRWDQNYGTLDVDILGVDQTILGYFNAEKNGYCGHHPKRISDKFRTYSLQIRIPETQILSANITFKLNHGHKPGLFS
jgi:hypothetical protein